MNLVLLDLIKQKNCINWLQKKDAIEQEMNYAKDQTAFRRVEAERLYILTAKKDAIEQNYN